jgi:hypothetical protein
LKKSEQVLIDWDNKLINENAELSLILRKVREVKEKNTPEISEKIYSSVIDIIRKRNYSK